MRPDTVRAVDRLDKLLDDEDFAAMVSADMWLVSLGRYRRNTHMLTASDIQIIRSLLRKLPAAEECLTRGGMVKDWDGAWCREGDRVRFRETAGSELETGELHYDDSSFSLYVFSDRTQESYLLGDVYEWHKEKNDDEV